MALGERKKGNSLYRSQIFMKSPRTTEKECTINVTEGRRCSFGIRTRTAPLTQIQEMSDKVEKCCAMHLNNNSLLQLHARETPKSQK